MYKYLKILILLLALNHFSYSAEIQKANNSPVNLKVPVGKPSYTIELYYMKLYDKKPWHGANVYYYNNGVYKVVSPGESHYGVYTLEGGDFKQSQFDIYHISMPSQDWGNKTAYLKLSFDSKDHTFIQTTKLQTGDKVNFEFGTFKLKKNTYTDPYKIDWIGKDRSNNS